MLCVAENAATAHRITPAVPQWLMLGCDNNWAVWNVGTRTQWNIDSQTYIGVDVVYQVLQTATVPDGLATFGFGQQPAATRDVDDQSAFMAQFRVHRNFYP